MLHLFGKFLTKNDSFYEINFKNFNLFLAAKETSKIVFGIFFLFNGLS